jgi:diguanylate cyclase (GGDEF)-like protein/PAS domain S-box-containing protein
VGSREAGVEPGHPEPLSGDAVLAARPALDALLSDVTEVVVLLDGDDRLAYAAPGLVPLLGWSPAEVVGRPVTDFIASDAPTDSVRRVVERSGESRVETRVTVRAADGTDRALLVSASGPSELRNAGWWTVVLRATGDASGTVSALSQRMAFEDLQTRVASSFLSRASHEVDDGIAEALAEVGRFAAFDRAYLYELDRSAGIFELTHEWMAPGVAPRPAAQRRLSPEDLPSWTASLRSREPIYLAGLGRLAAEGWGREEAVLSACSVRSVLAVPLLHGDELLGFIGVDAIRAERLWADDHVAVLQSLAGVVSQALVRRDAEQRFALAFEAAPLGMALLSSEGAHLQVNPAYAELSGLAPDALASLRIIDLVASEHQEALGAALAGMAAGRDDRVTLELPLAVPADRRPWVRLHVAAVRGTDASLRHTVVHVEDVTERRRREIELQASERRYRTLVEHGPALVARFAADLTLVYASPAVALLAEELGVELDEAASALPWRPLLDRVVAGSDRAEDDWDLDLQGDHRWFRSRAVAERSGTGEVEHVLVMTTDVTALRRSEAELEHRSLHDPVTGLGNRELIDERLREALAVPDRVTAVMMLDLDRFKHVNDSLGHDAGDELLSVVAGRLAAFLPTASTLARLGGDEFVAIIDHVGSPEVAMALADGLRTELARPLSLAGTEVTTTASIGIAVRQLDSSAPTDLLRDADSAMYLAKARGRDRCELCDDQLRHLASERLDMERHLRRSLDQGELIVHYQPEIDVATGALVGTEALARWKHPDKGLLEAGAFIGMAEETGLIVSLGRWILEEACRQAGEWQRRHGAPATIRVNLSPRQLTEPDLVAMVAAAIQRSGLAPGALCLEVTETALMEDLERSLSILGELRALGLRLAVDDFGTGYSSLAQLKRFPVDVLKIDRAFIDGLGRNESDTAIVEAIVALAASLGLEVVAEGVEHEVQLAELVRLGCQRAQGYLLGRPDSAAAMTERLESVG